MLSQTPKFVAAAILFAAALVPASGEADRQTFNAILAELWPLAEAQSISRATFDKAFAGLTPDARVIAITKRQPEYGKPAGDYINATASAHRIANGRRLAVQWRSVLDRAETTFGVDRWVLLALWGMESSFGEAKIPWDVIRSLATLVHAGYRAPYFRKELLASLKILQDGHVARASLLGSWAGAMGQPQFMPSTFYQYAVDFSDDGRKDIWTNVPDVLASIANYLAREGWKPELPWGSEVTVPDGFDYGQSRGTFAEWTARGFKRATGAALPGDGGAILLFPSGAEGPAFLVTENFSAIKRYNNSDVYALAVAILADRMRGAPPVRAAWPRDDRQLSREQRMALQRRLAALGYAVRDFEGRIDFDLRDAVREQQAKLGMRPDGHPTAALIERLGAVPSR